MNINHLKRNSHATTFVYSEDGKFIYPKIAKTGGTSVQNELDKKYKIIHDTCKQESFFEKENIEEYYLFTFVRNPWDRVLSLYYVFNKNLKVDFDSFVFKYISKYSNPMSKEDFSKLSPSMNSFHRHCLHQNICFYDGEDFYVDFIGRFENIKEDFKVVKEKLSLDRNLVHLNKGVSNKKDFYTTKTIDAVGEIYKKDVELLKYEYRMHN